MIKVTLRVALHVQAPFLTKGSTAGAMGVDAPLATTRAGGKPNYVLPFSLIRGRVRDALVSLTQKAPGTLNISLDELLGPPPPQDSSPHWDPQRGRVAFSDFLLTLVNGKAPGPTAAAPEAGGELGSQAPARQSTSIRHNEAFQAAHSGALQVIDKPFAAGSLVEFTGDIHFLATDQAAADKIVAQIRAGLGWLCSVGADISVGFGKIDRAEIKETDSEPLAAPSTSLSTATYLRLKLLVEDPICISKRRLADNLFESADTIPGNALKGALATTIIQGFSGLNAGVPLANQADQAPAEWRPLLRNFDAIEFSFAFPSLPDGNRPIVRPLSLVQDRKGKVLKDMALCAEPMVIRTADGGFGAPAFDVDWKKSDLAAAEFPWPVIERELRARTAIDTDQRRAKDEGLFAYGLVLPHLAGWEGYVKLDRVPKDDCRAVRGALEALLGFGVGSLGKTKARATATLTDAPAPEPASEPAGALWIITLQTPALLLDPTSLNETSGGKELFDGYEESWNDISEGTLHLVRFFARQSLAGGYVVGRYRNGRPYNPFLLTDAGSVFVLKATSPMARKRITGWMVHGLDLPSKVVTAYGGDWQTNQYLPGHGFGEISVNLPCHEKLQPKEDEYVNA